MVLSFHSKCDLVIQKLFEKMIRAQTYRMSNNFVIILNCVGPDVMHYISDRILTTEGVQAVLPCKSLNDDGKYKVLVNKDQYHATREKFMTEFTQWINEYAAPDAKATLTKYPNPAEVVPINSDVFSHGEMKRLGIDEPIRRGDEEIGMFTRSKTDQVAFIATLRSDPGVPKTFQKAKDGRNRHKWVPSAKEEINNFLSREAWKKFPREALKVVSQYL